MPGAALGPENPLPPLQPNPVLPTITIDDNVPEAARRYIGLGCNNAVLPYRMQDNYTREKQECAFRVAVLENECLRALFLLDYGGRLWSLFHKPLQRELLDRNPVFQPGNLAIRNAWFSGGVEWNAGIPGHCPFTCSPVFAAQVQACNNEPILRLYEYERVRGVPFQIDFTLPAGSPWLFAHLRIINPHDATIPMYWWSNIAVPETGDTRILVPANAAYHCGASAHLRRLPVPQCWDTDITRPVNLLDSSDFFYDIHSEDRTWITALDGEGRGLIQTSTMRQRGRKLFVWGQNPGGRRWQEFLSQPGHAYLEIQAGLARTQYESLPMPPNQEWRWIEAYGLMEADPAIVHGSDWDAAVHHVNERLELLLSEYHLEIIEQAQRPNLNVPPQSILHRGSGWGVLESRRRAKMKEPFLAPRALIFDDASLMEEQVPWATLLEQGELPYRPVDAEPGAYMTQTEWRALLERALREGRGDHWLSWLHLGVMKYAGADYAGAREAWERSLALEPSAWALRNLAWLAHDSGGTERTADLLCEANTMLPSLTPLAIECADALLKANRAEEALRLCDTTPCTHPRLGFLRARAHLALGNIDFVEHYLLSRPEIPDMREGEVSLTDLWFALHEQRLARQEDAPITDALRKKVREMFPPPAEIDFRMNVTKEC